MGFKKWQVAEYDKELAKSLAEECGIDPIVALIASSRGYTDPCALEEFVSDELIFSNPLETADIIRAAEIVNAVIEDGEKIAIYGDYDCDGVCATSLLFRYLKSRGADVIYYIPDRFEEGYGMNTDAIYKLHEQGVKLIITVDNGIKSFEEANLAEELGITLVVTDHHLPSDEIPKAAAVVDPHRKDCTSSYKSICGTVVVYRLVCVMENCEMEELFDEYADLLTVATIADIMPLELENRGIVKFGVEKIKNAPIVGISALLNVAGIAHNAVNAQKVAFGIAPRINAAGRMGKASRAVELLCTENMMTALSIANEIDADNSARQQIEKKIFEEAIKIIETNGYEFDRVIVVSGNGWHHGVVGIVASRIAEKYGKPAILVSTDGETSSGSGRSIEGFSLYDALEHCADLMIKFGGHDQAAGVTLSADKVDEFRKKINDFAYLKEFTAPVLKLDCKLNPAALSLDLCFALELLEPYGFGNKTPLFGIFGAKLERISPIANNKHLRLLFSKGNNSFQCILFGMSTDAFCYEIGDILDLAVGVEANYYNDNYTLSVQIKSLRLSGIDDETLFYDIEQIDRFRSGRDFCTNVVLPTRENIGLVYKKICEKPILEDRIINIFMGSIGFAKTYIALKVLIELNLVTKNTNRSYSAVGNAAKTNLNASETFKYLTERSNNNVG